MPSHCRCCSGKFLDGDVLGDCPGCPECADAAEWHRAIMEETCDAGTQDDHCTCVPILRARIKELEDLYHATVKDMQDTSQQRADILNTIAGQRDAAITRAADAQGECAEKSALIADCEVENVRLRKEIARITAVLESLAGMRRE